MNFNIFEEKIQDYAHISALQGILKDDQDRTQMNEKELTDRIKNAITLLSDGHPFKVGDLTFGCDNKTKFFVSGWIESFELKNISKTRALNELTETKQLFSKMLAVSTDLKKFIENQNVEYSLCYNYGMGSLELCRERNGNIEWITELNDN